MADTGKTIGLIKALASVDPEAIKSSVDDWLDDHPEATTTVEDGAITKAKLDSSLQQTVDDVGDLKSANTYNLLKDLIAASSGTVYEVTYTNNGNGTWTVTTSSAASNTVAKTIYGSSSSIPTGFTPGKTYYVKYSATNVGLALVATKNGTQLSNTIIYSDTVYRLDPTATGFELKLRVAKNNTANETVCPVVFNALTDSEETEYINELRNASPVDLLDGIKPTSATVNGVTFTWNVDRTCTVTNQATGNTRRPFVGGSSSFPAGFAAGQTVFIEYSGTDVALAIVEYVNGSARPNIPLYYTDTVYTIGADTTGLELALRVASGVSLNETVKPVVWSADTNKGLTDLVHNPVYNSNFMHSIINCAKSYMVASDTGFFTYGSQSALDYNAEAPRQIHCGALTALIDGGCSFYDSRYVDPSGENRLYTSGYGFDFYAYSLKLALAGDADEIAYIGADNLTKTVDELKRLELFKSSAQLCAALNRWGMLFDVTSGTSINNNVLKPGDIIFYGNTSGSSQTDIVNGYHITHCDCVIGYKNGIPWVIDGGSVPITLHQAVYNSGFDYRIGGRVPLGLEL